MGATQGQPTAVAWAADYLKRKYAKPGNVFVGVVSRLDSFVTGVLVLARTSKAAARLTKQFHERLATKRYWAVVEGELRSAQWQLATDWIVKNDSLHRMVAVGANSRLNGAQEARLRWKSLAQSGSQSLLEVDLLTGRKHQIRLQLAELGHPIVGDSKYGARTTFPDSIALHAHYLSISHPTRDEVLTFHAAMPSSWRRLPVAKFLGPSPGF